MQQYKPATVAMSEDEVFYTDDSDEEGINAKEDLPDGPEVEAEAADDLGLGSNNPEANETELDNGALLAAAEKEQRPPAPGLRESANYLVSTFVDSIPGADWIPILNQYQTPARSRNSPGLAVDVPRTIVPDPNNPEDVLDAYTQLPGVDKTKLTTIRSNERKWDSQFPHAVREKVTTQYHDRNKTEPLDEVPSNWLPALRDAKMPYYNVETQPETWAVVVEFTGMLGGTPNVLYTPYWTSGDETFWYITEKYGRYDQLPIVSYDEMVACMAIDHNLKKDQRVSAGGVIKNDNILLDFDYNESCYLPAEGAGQKYKTGVIPYYRDEDKWLSEHDAKAMDSFPARQKIEEELTNQRRRLSDDLFHGERWTIKYGYILDVRANGVGFAPHTTMDKYANHLLVSASGAYTLSRKSRKEGHRMVYNGEFITEEAHGNFTAEAHSYMESGNNILFVLFDIVKTANRLYPTAYSDQIKAMTVPDMITMTNKQTTKWKWKLGGNAAAGIGLYHLLLQCPYMPESVASWISMIVLTMPVAQQFIAFVMENYAYLHRKTGAKTIGALDVAREVANRFSSRRAGGVPGGKANYNPSTDMNMLKYMGHVFAPHPPVSAIL